MAKTGVCLFRKTGTINVLAFAIWLLCAALAGCVSGANDPYSIDVDPGASTGAGDSQATDVGHGLAAGAGGLQPTDTGSSLPTKPGDPQPIKDGSELTIYIASDLHYFSASLSDGSAAYQEFANMRDGKEVLYGEQIVDAFIDQVKHDKPDALILSGDLTVNGEKQGHLDVAAKLGTIDPDITQVYVIPGNHDINNVYARGFAAGEMVLADYVGPSGFAEIYGSFGLAAAASRDISSLSYLSKPAPDFWILMIDSSMYEDNLDVGAPSTGGLIEDGTLSWIEACAKEAKAAGATLVAASHHNLLEHNELLILGYTIYNHSKLLSVFKENSVRLNFSGHIHCQDIASEDGIYDIASNALSVCPHKYGVLAVGGADMSYSAKRLDVDAWAKAKGLTEPDLLNYSAYTKSRFDETMSQITVADLDGSHTDEQKTAMVDFFKELNRRYFAGEDLSPEEVEGVAAYQLLLEEEGFLGRYVKTIAHDGGVDDNALVLPR